MLAECREHGAGSQQETDASLCRALTLVLCVADNCAHIYSVTVCAVHVCVWVHKSVYKVTVGSKIYVNVELTLG